MKSNYIFFLLCCALPIVSCGGSKAGQSAADGKTRAAVSVPTFSADSAYRYVEAQVGFGPRVPNTPAHTACADYLTDRLKAFGATVAVQQFEVAAYDGTLLKARNIIGSYRPETKKRIALFSHWDSRPWADADPDAKKHYTPVLGANDGASGVGVLLEVARQLNRQLPALGIDIILLDVEDYGAHQDYKGNHREEFWGMGAQYWARNPHVPAYRARFGILLDMVGGKGARFRYESYSEQYASSVNRKVWKAARSLGFGDIFVQQAGFPVTDDHLFVNRYAGIPTIDIVPYSENSSFFEHWHTVRDDMDAIDKSTLQAVGQTVLEVIYKEQ
jgi:Zn-dependent M28 family amino/carboxypeptidase